MNAMHEEKEGREAVPVPHGATEEMLERDTRIATEAFRGAR